MRKYAIIAGGGSGTRMGAGIPKQFRSLCGRPMLWWSMKAFHDEDPETEILLVLPIDFVSLWNDYFEALPKNDKIPHKVTIGGSSRTESVKNGLLLVGDNETLVAIHDGARPMISRELIRRGWNSVQETGAAIPVIDVVDSLREVSGDVSVAVDRSRFKAVQTPQVFISGLLKKAYELSDGKVFTDDATAVESMGGKITIFEGERENLKVTTPKDMLIASFLLQGNA